MRQIRTDMAMESAREAGDMPGVKVSGWENAGIHVTEVQLTDPDSAQKLGKPVGNYITLESEALRRRDPDARLAMSAMIGEEIARMAGEIGERGAMVVGLGNRMVTPDALGPLTVDKILVTRQIFQELTQYADERLRSVCAMAPGVMGVTGIETAEMLESIVRRIRPGCVVCVDALSARSARRIGAAVQICDTGIQPGSGVGNRRLALNRETLGVIVHSGDFKVDYTPVDGARIDLGRFAELGQKGVLLLMCESTNVERPGYTMSERTVGETFMNLFEKADGRIIVAMFASNIHRIQLVVDAARQYGRKVCLVGRSMINVAKVAMQLGDLKIPPADLVAAEDIDDYPDSKIAIVTTGSQGEPMSGLSRMAFAEHRKLSIRSTDMVIVSATPIPGNEKSVSRVINQLVRTGANVIYEALAEVHVSGHARREEIKLIHALTKPKFFIPIHGEYRHLYHHANLAKSMGMPEENVLIPEIGDVVELDAKSMKSAGMVQSGAVLVDGLGVGDVGSVVLRDRKLLAEDGMLIVVMGVDHELGEVVTGPDIISRGFVYMREADDLMDGAREAARKAIEEYGQIDSSDWSHIKTDVRDSVQKYIYDRLKRKPMILPIIVEI